MCPLPLSACAVTSWMTVYSPSEAQEKNRLLCEALLALPSQNAPGPLLSPLAHTPDTALDFVGHLSVSSVTLELSDSGRHAV